MTRMVSISQEVVDNIVEKSDHPAQAIIEFMKFAVPDDWENVKQINRLPKVSKNTALAILETLGNKFDKIKVNMLWLNSGFGINNQIKDWVILIPEGSYTLIKDTSDPIMEMMAKREIEEFINSDNDA